MGAEISQLIRLDDASSAAATVRRLVLGSTGNEHPVASIDAFARAIDVEAKEADLAASAGGCEAVIAPRSSGGFAVLVDVTPRSGWAGLPCSDHVDTARQRFRFRVAHEIGHTLFYEQPKSRTPRRVHPSSPAEEAFCDRFASALLLPDPVVRRCRTAAQLVRIQRRYDVSLEVAARAWAEVDGRTAALFHWAVKDWTRIQWTNARVEQTRAWLRLVNRAVHEDGRAREMVGDVVLLPARRQAVVLAD
jgi:IrrE N-terminal-like domain